MPDSALILGFLMCLFFGSHITLGLPAIRNPLERQFGPGGFSLLFFVVAELSFAALMLYLEYSPHSRYPALSFAWAEGAATVLGLLSSFGVALMIIGLFQFRQSTVLPHRGSKIIGIFKVTRHPFFFGLSLLSWVHIFLASSFNTQLFYFGLGLYTLVGMLLQDRKLKLRHGAAYAEVIRNTSFIPFIAILQKKQRLGWDEIPTKALLVSLAFIVGFRLVHPYFIAFGGIKILIAVALIGPGALMLMKSKQGSTAPNTESTAQQTHN